MDDFVIGVDIPDCGEYSDAEEASDAGDLECAELMRMEMTAGLAQIYLKSNDDEAHFAVDSDGPDCSEYRDAAEAEDGGDDECAEILAGQ